MLVLSIGLASPAPAQLAVPPVAPPAPAPAPAEPPPPPVKKPVPSAAELKPAAAQANQLFRKDIADARTPAQRGELLKRLRRIADDEPRPDMQYTVLMLIRDLVLRWDEHHAVGLSALSAVEMYFEADTLDPRTEVLIRGANKAAGARHAHYAEFAIEMAEPAIRAERFDAAKRIASVAQNAARRAAEPPLTARATTLARNITTAEQLSKEAATLLAKSPGDPKTHRAVGRLRCLVKDDWAGGLPLLTQGDDLVLRSIARLELENPTGAESQALLADAWLEAGRNETGLVRERMFARARAWYGRALAEAQGLTKVRIEKVLPEIDKQLDAAPPRIEKTYVADLTATGFDKNNEYRFRQPALPRRPAFVPPNGAVAAPPVPKNVVLAMGTPRGSISHVTYAIPQNARTLSGAVAYDSTIGSANGPSELIFRIYVDGKPRWESRPLARQESEPFEVRVANGAELRLELEYTGRNGYPPGTWQDPAFE